MKQQTILVIDDHALFRSGVAAMLSMAFGDVTLLDVASLDEALETIAPVPAVVLLDIQLPGLSGLEGMSLIQQRWPAARIVVVSAHDLPGTVDAAIAGGAAAFLSKTERPERMIAALRPMLAAPFPDPVEERAVRDAVRPRLTPRQMEVLNLAGQGLSNKMIGKRLGLSEHTVRGHMQALLAVLGVARRTEAIFKARQIGLIR